MTKIDLDTSPLQAAREWRGASLVSVAMNCGLPIAQAEALESGDPGAFDCIDEMIAAAVLYGASMGIGRDEAMALLDRTVGREAAVAELGTAPVEAPARPNGAFSGAVRERAAKIADRGEVVVAPAAFEAPLADVVLDDQPSMELPALAFDADLPPLPQVPVQEGPTPEQAVAASGELHLDEAFGPDAPWERTGSTGELEAWVDDYEDDDELRVDARRDGVGVVARVGGATHAALERIIGTDRADALADRTRDLSVRVSELARRGRERLRSSEHATLIVAIGAGAVLIAIVVALGGAIGGGDDAGPGPAKRDTATASSSSSSTGSSASSDASDAAAKAPATPAAVLPPAKLNVDVYNAGSQKGRAKDVAATLQTAGYNIGEVTNSKTDYAGARIIYPKGMAREARQLARRTGITTLEEAPGSTRRITVIVT